METRGNEHTSSDCERSLTGPELRIVLIGGRELNCVSSTTSATGNIILGQCVFETDRRTAQSVVRQHQVHGRRVTVVNTPHWLWHYPRHNTPLLDQMEIKRSVHLCPPGPHAILLVIPLRVRFPQVCKQSLIEHLQLFQRDVFKNTIVLFTVETSRSNRHLEDYVRSFPALQWVLEQCGNRKHILDIRDHKDSAQVRSLFQKIDAMVAENAGSLVSVDGAEGSALKEKMEAIAERASKRFSEVQRRRRELRALIQGGKTPPTHLRLVMVGAQWSAKSSAGNTILKKQAFTVRHRRQTKNCETSHSRVANRQLTVVDSPGWFYNHTLQDTSEMDKREIESSVCLCPPGPHAVLLVVGLASAINAPYLRAVQEHMSLFTGDVWKHTMVLFTRGDWLGSKTVEERIESEEGLQWLVEKCGNMYHVLDNTKQLHEIQVTELLEKIEEMWAGNKEPHFEGALSSEEEVEARREARQRMAKKIQNTSRTQDRILRELFKGDWRKITDMRIVLVGRKDSGKSMAGNGILRKDLFGSGLMKKEFQDQRRTMTCVKHQIDVSGINISVVETPGWLPDGETPDWLKTEVLRSVSMCAPGPHVFLVVVPISKSFTKADTKAVVELLMPLGEKVWRHCMVLFTWGDWLNDRPVEDYIAAECENLKWLVEKCGNRYLASYYCNASSSMELYHKINSMITRNKGCCFTTEENQGKKHKSVLFFKEKSTLTEEEWNRREQELVDRLLKALAQEPGEPTNPPERMAGSIDLAYIPSLSGDAPSEVGSTLWTTDRKKTQTCARVSEWLRFKAGNSDVTSGVGSMCASASYLEDVDETPLTDHYHTGCFSLDKDQMMRCHVLPGSVSERRHSL